MLIWGKVDLWKRCVAYNHSHYRQISYVCTFCLISQEVIVGGPLKPTATQLDTNTANSTHLSNQDAYSLIVQELGNCVHVSTRQGKAKQLHALLVGSRMHMNKTFNET